MKIRSSIRHFEVGSTQEQNDSSILNTIFDRCGKDPRISIYSTKQQFSDIVKLIRNADLMISTRLHGGIFSILSNTPVVPISYMDKVKNFWSNTGLDVTPISVTELSFEILKIEILRAIHNKDRYRGSLNDYRTKLPLKFHTVVEVL